MQHGERDAPAGAIALDGRGALVDPDDRSDLRLQIVVGERNRICTTLRSS